MLLFSASRQNVNVNSIAWLRLDTTIIFFDIYLFMQLLFINLFIYSFIHSLTISLTLLFTSGIIYLFHSIQINHQPYSTIFQFIILTFVYSSTCFGLSPAHHQELMTAVAASGFTFVSW